jgi:hypothetical protein
VAGSGSARRVRQGTARQGWAGKWQGRSFGRSCFTGRRNGGTGDECAPRSKTGRLIVSGGEPRLPPRSTKGSTKPPTAIDAQRRVLPYVESRCSMIDDELLVALQRSMHRFAAALHGLATNVGNLGTALVDLVHAWEAAKAPPDDPDPEPQPGDGPDYHHDHAAWLRRHGN